MERPEGVDYVRALVKRMLDARIEATYRFAARSVLIPVSAAGSMFPPASPVEGIEKQIQAFIAAQGGGRDFV